MNLSGIVVHSGLIGGFIVLQSTLFQNGLIRGAVPDIALLLLVFSANQHGSMKGEGAGFATGLLHDFLSLAPLGFHALIGTLIGFLGGLSRGRLILDPILIPVMFAVVATLLKALLSIILFALFLPELVGTVFNVQFGITLGLNALIAPFLYSLLHFARIFRKVRERR